MTEEQAKKMISILTDIESHASSISTYVMELETKLEEVIEAVKELKK